MAFHCAWCGSTNVQPQLDEYQCLNCTKLSFFDGTRSITMVTDANGQEVPWVQNDEPSNQHPDRRRRPGDVLNEEESMAFNPVPDPEPQEVPEPAEPEVTQGPADEPEEEPVTPEPEATPEPEPEPAVS